VPFWKRLSAEDRERWQQEQQAAELSRQSLEAGGLPTRAKQRLSEEINTLFTSDLSVKELTLARQKGYQPVSQVMGSSIYHVGWQYRRQYVYRPVAQELEVLSDAHQNAALLALGRLEQEAMLLHAHGVIGVRFTRRQYAWGSDLLEYTAIGTAIRLPDVPYGERPFLSDLSGQEFWTLLQAGYFPAGVVVGYCSYYVCLGSNLTQQLQGYLWGSGMYNQEIRPFTQGLYTARHLAMSHAQDMARSMNAQGIVGMHIDSDRNVMEYETENPSRRYMDLFTHFSVLGTAITAHSKEHEIPKLKPTLTFTDLRPGRYGQNRELTFRD